MALTRAQLLSGNQSNGIVLPGQPQGVIAGAGIQISNTGIISVDSSSVTGLVKLNDPFAYNSYVWPGADGTAGEFLQTDGAGNLDWATPQGFAVVTVHPQPAPVPSDVGELWFDCSTGTLNVYQDCVGGTGWFNVAQPGFPVLPGSTSAVPPFANQGTPGAGTQANPYDCTVTTVSSGSSTFIVNTVTVTGLAAFQYVPIVDLNAVANLGRFSFSNYYADSSGVLTFQVIFKDLPASGSGVTYNAAIRVGYASVYIDAVVNVTLPLTLSGGSITGTPTSGTPVAFTPPTASGGSGGYTYTYQWFADGLPITGATNAAFTPTTAEVGKTLSVTTTVTDSSSATASTTTTASSQTAGSPISNWAATGSMTTIPGGLSGVYTGAGTTVTVTGCIEAAVYTPPALPTYVTTPQAITSGQTLAIRWSTSVACGGAASGTPISGTVTDGIGTNSYNVTVNRIPTPAIGDITDTNVALNGTVSKGIATPISGLTTPAFVTYVGTSTGGTIGASLTPGGPFTPLATSGTGFQINNLQTLYIQQTAGSAINTSPGYTAIIRVGDGTNTAGSYDEFTYFAQTVATATFPGLVFSPAGGPNAAPASVSLLGPPALEGTATATGGWPGASPSPTSLTVTGSIQISINGAAYVGAGGPYTISTGQSLSIIWDPALVAAAADGATLTGSITDGTYTNTFSLTVTRAVTPASFAFADVDPVPLSSTNTSATVTPTGFNVPVTLSIAGATTNPMTTPLSQVGTGGFSAAAKTVNPGDGIQLQGTAGGTVSTVYGIDATIGSGPAATDTWTTKTTSSAPTVAQPTISTPGAGATGQGTASGLTITSSAYSASGGAGTHASSNWELYANSYPLQSTNTISGVTAGAAPAWTQVAFPAASVNFVSYGNGIWVAGSSAGRYSTDDGLTWNTPTTPWSAYSPRSMVYNGGFFTGIGAGNKVVRSSDGNVWSDPNTGFPSNISFNSIKAGGGLLVAAGGVSTLTSADRNIIIHSSDNGLTWTRNNISTTGNTLMGLAFDGTNWMTVSETGNIFVTTDPTGAWVSRAVPAGVSSWQELVAVGPSTFVASGVSTGNIGITAKTTDNGLNWTVFTHTGTTQLAALAYANGLFVVGSSLGPYLATSTDGLTWTSQTTGIPASLCIEYGGGTWMAGGSSNTWTSAAPSGTTILTIAGCQTEGFLAGDTVVSVAAGGGPATILSLDDTQVTVTSSTGWIGNNTQTLKRDPASYSLAASATADTTNLVSWPVAKPPLAAFTKYYTRVQYTSNATVVTSAWSPWREFTTGSLIPAIGALYGGGYFAGQINDGGTIYNLVVAPVEGNTTGPVTGGALKGQNGGATPTGIQWKTSATGPDTNAQSMVYGATAMLANSGATWPMFNWCVSGATGPNAGTYDATNAAGTGIGGYNDWYIPAQNELAILYFFLKPDSTANTTSSGSNANSVAPYTPNTNYGAGFPNVTSSALFAGGAQAFSTASSYWSSSESSSLTFNAELQSFNSGGQSGSVKNNPRYARAVRRVAA